MEPETHREVQRLEPLLPLHQKNSQPKEAAQVPASEEKAATTAAAAASAPPEELRETPLSTTSTPRFSDQGSDVVAAAVPLVPMIGGSGYLPHRLSEQIEADVLRTFPNVKQFQEMGGPDQLRRVLRTIAAGDPELGYCQSMNFIAANFIILLNDESFAHLAVRQLLVKLGTRCWYTDGMKQLRADTAVLEDLMRERLPNVHAVLRAHRFDLLFVSSKWFLCLFATTLQGEALRRVWDVMLCDGIEAVFRVALAMLSLGTESILNAASHDDLIFLFQDWHLSASPEALIAAAYDQRTVGPISRAELSQRRRQAATKVSSDDTRENMRNNKFARGGVRPASMHAR